MTDHATGAVRRRFANPTINTWISVKIKKFEIFIPNQEEQKLPAKPLLIGSIPFAASNKYRHFSVFLNLGKL